MVTVTFETPFFSDMLTDQAVLLGVTLVEI